MLHFLLVFQYIFASINTKVIHTSHGLIIAIVICVGRKSKPAPVVVSPMMHRAPSMSRAPSMHRSPSVHGSTSIHSNHSSDNAPGVSVRSPSMRQIDRAHSLKAPSLNRGPATVHQVDCCFVFFLSMFCV